MIKKKENKKVQELEQKCQEYLEGWQRCMADWKNYKAQQEERNSETRRAIKEEFALDLIGVLDNFSLALEHLPNTKETCDWEAGVGHIKKQMEAILDKLGVSEIKVEEKNEFNPHEHECFEDPKCDSKDKLIIEKVILRGYKIDDKILRPARVKVKKK